MESCAIVQLHGRTKRPYNATSVDFWPRRGQCGKRKKSVKKNAALLHFLGFFSLTLLFGVPRGERLAAHNERRQFAAQTRSCGYSPRWGEHCSLPGFAALNRGPLLATPQSPRPGFAASEQRVSHRSCKEGGLDPSLRTDHKRVTPLRGVEDAAPYKAIGIVTPKLPQFLLRSAAFSPAGVRPHRPVTAAPNNPNPAIGRTCTRCAFRYPFW